MYMEKNPIKIFFKKDFGDKNFYYTNDKQINN